MVTSPEKQPANGIRREIDVNSPPGEVWEVLVDDDERSAWFGGRTTLEPRPGGQGWFEDTDGSRRSASVEQADPGRRLSWTWWPESGTDDGSDEGTDGASLVQIDLTPLPGGTRISVTETPLTPAAQASALTGARGPLFDLELRIITRSMTTVVLTRT